MEKILGLKLIEVPDVTTKKHDAPVVLYAVNNYSYRVCDVGKYSYNHVFTQQFRHNN